VTNPHRNCAPHCQMLAPCFFFTRHCWPDVSIHPFLLPMRGPLND